MTETATRPVDTDRPAHRPVAAVLGLAALAGVVLGAGDLVLQLTLPYPVADLANSAAVWAALALLLTRWLRTGPLVSAVAGALALVVAVEAYYVLAALLDLSAWTGMVRSSSLAWAAMGVVSGAGFGLAGAWSRRGATWLAAAAVALGPAVLVAEAWLRRDWGGTSVLTALVGVVLLVGLARDRVLLGRALVLLAPFAVVCVALYGAAGF